MKKTKVLEWVCLKCGKQIISLHKAQLENNRDIHILKCKKIGDKNDNKISFG